MVYFYDLFFKGEVDRCTIPSAKEYPGIEPSQVPLRFYPLLEDDYSQKIIV